MRSVDSAGRPPDHHPVPATTPAPLPLSVAITCRDNERTIGRLLDSLASLGGTSEVVALDSGSTDETIAILERHGAQVIRGQWRGHTQTKQDVMERCTRPWVLNLDSDESLEPRLGASIAEVLRRDNPAIVACSLNRQTWYRGKPLRYAWQPDRLIRLVRRNAGRWAGVEPHPYLELGKGSEDRVLKLDGGDGANLRHDSFETFAEHLERQAKYAREGAQALLASGKQGSFLKLLTSPSGAFFKQIVLKQAYRDGYAGWLAAASTTAGAMMKHAILIEISRGVRADTPSSPRPPSSGPHPNE